MRWGHGLAVALAASLTGPAASAEPVILRLGGSAPEGSPWADALEALARLIDQNTRGAVRLKLIHGAVVGSEAEMARDVARGSLDGWGASVGAAEGLLPEMSVLELPFLFRNGKEVDHILVRLWPLLERTVASRGYRFLGMMDVGFRHLGTQAPISNLADLRRTRLRSQPSRMHTRMWDLLGIQHTPVSLPDVMGALEERKIDALDSAVVWLFVSAWHQQIRTLTLSAHMYQPGFVVLGPGGLAKVPGPLQRQLTDGMLEVCLRYNKKVREVERSLLASLPGMGVEVRPVPPGLRAEMGSLVAPQRDEWRANASPAGKRLLVAIERELALARGHELEPRKAP